MITLLLILVVLIFILAGTFVGLMMSSFLFTDYRDNFKWPGVGDAFAAVLFFFFGFFLWPAIIMLFPIIDWLGNIKEDVKTYMCAECFKDVKIVCRHFGGSFRKIA